MEHKRKFVYAGKEYDLFIDASTGLEVTRPAIGSIDAHVYESGHYEVKGSMRIPFLLNFLDYSLSYCQILFYKRRGLKSLLDFGCGKGYFLYYLKRFDYLELAGVETSRPRADYAQNLLSLQVQRDYYNGGMILGKKWSCISLFHVLEHIDGPFVLLENLIGGAVEQDGMIYIEVPNYYSISSVIAGDYWAHFTPHFHTNHFTVRSLTNLCVNSLFNFKVVGTFSFYNGILGMLSAILRVFNYRGSIFEDLKSRKVPIIVLVFFLSPIALLLEFAGSVIFKRGSVIKLIIWRK